MAWTMIRAELMREIVESHAEEGGEGSVRELVVEVYVEEEVVAWMGYPVIEMKTRIWSEIRKDYWRCEAQSAGMVVPRPKKPS